MSNIIKNRALILKAMKWRDSSKIVTMLTEESGVLKVIAKGAARDKSPFRGKIEALNLIEVIISNRSSRFLQILKEVYVIDSFMGIKTDIIKLAYAFSILEILDQIFQEGQGDVVFFDFIIVLIQNMEQARMPELLFLYFLLKLASYLGFKPELSGCRKCKGKDFKTYYFSAKEGVLLCPKCVGGERSLRLLSNEEIMFLRKLQLINHKKIGLRDNIIVPDISLRSFLLNYLSIHLGFEIHLESLRLINESI